jgi:hypothetical protein
MHSFCVLIVIGTLCISSSFVITPRTCRQNPTMASLKATGRAASEADALAVLQQLKNGELTVADLLGPLYGARKGMTSGLPNYSKSSSTSTSSSSVKLSEQPRAADEAEATPSDQYNTALISNVHPPSYANPKPLDEYDLVVVGAGVAGLLSVIMASALGAKCALIERHYMGGDCLNVSANETVIHRLLMIAGLAERLFEVLCSTTLH